MAAISVNVSQRVHESMRKAIARYELLSAHIEGIPEREITPCAECLEADMHPRRVRARCEPGRDLHSAVWEAIAIASTLISQARTRAGLAPTILSGSRFSIEDHIRRFYEWEFSGSLSPRPRRPRAQTTLPKRIELTDEQMTELKNALKKGGPKPGEPAPKPKEQDR
jgi:hypothetical protein